MPNDLLTTNTDILGFEVPVLYSGASGINVDNQNYVISFTGTAYGSGGKTYQGVAPIVVNNGEDKISANTTPFGVLSPLYFAQDDDSGVVIGFSGDIDPVILSSKLDVSAFEAWQTGQYTNDIATITNNVSAISSEIPDVSQFVTSSDLSTLSSEITGLIPSTAGLVSETYVQQQVSSKLDESAYSTQSGNFLIAIPAEYATQDWVTGQNYLTSVPPEYSTSGDLVTLSSDIVSHIPDVSNYATLTDLESTSADITAMIPSTAGLASETYVDQNISSKLDSTAFSTVSGNFLTAVDLSNYYQKTDTSSKDELDYAFSHITVGGSTYTSPLNTILVDNENSTLEGTDSAYVSDAPLEALILTANGLQQSETRINGNKLSWDFTVKNEGFLFGTSRINFTAYNELNQSLTSRQITASNGTHLVSSYYNPSATHFYATYLITSGNFSAISSYIGSGTVQLARKYELEKYQPLSSMGDYALRSWVTANYLSRAGAIEAYAKLSALETVSSDITSMIPSTAGLASENYVQTNSAVLTGMIDAKQDALTFGYDENDKINSINSSAIAGGGGGGNPEVEAYVTSNSGAIDDTVSTYQSNSGLYLQSSDVSSTEWNDCYNNVSTNSGVWGSNSLPISAGANIRLSLVNSTLVIDNDETVLWTGSSPMSAFSATLSESLLNFNEMYIVSHPHFNETFATKHYYKISELTGREGSLCTTIYGAGGVCRFNVGKFKLSSDPSFLYFTGQKQFSLTGTSITTAQSTNSITEIVGVGRKN